MSAFASPSPLAFSASQGRSSSAPAPGQCPALGPALTASLESIKADRSPFVFSASPVAASASTAPAPAPASRVGNFSDDAVLAGLMAKCKQWDPENAECIDPADLDPDIEVHELDTEPKITIVPNFVSDEEMAHILFLVQDRWAPSLVITSGANGQVKDLQQKGSEIRTSWSTLVDYAQTPIVAGIEKRLSALSGIDVNHLERLAMVRYEKGQQYKVHHDGIWRPMTVFIYLNDVAPGDEGETYFPNLDVKIVPRKGTAVMWPNTAGRQEFEDTRVMHAGLPPLSGIKYGVNCFFNQAPKRLLPEDAGDAFGGQGPPEAFKAHGTAVDASTGIGALPLQVPQPPAWAAATGEVVGQPPQRSGWGPPGEVRPLASLLTGMPVQSLQAPMQATSLTAGFQPRWAQPAMSSRLPTRLYSTGVPLLA